MGPPCLNICQVGSITALGDVLNNKLTAADHISFLMASCSSSLYALRVLRDHGYLQTLYETYIALPFLPIITYCACSQSGLCSANDCARLDAFLRCSKHYGYCADDTPTISELLAAADQSLFERVLRNKSHVLQPLLPEMISNRNL